MYNPFKKIINSQKDTVSRDAETTVKCLDHIVASITQTSNKLQNRLTNLFAAKLSGAGIYGTAMALLSMGTASTGTAIGTLSGAAASTAKLFWAGSLVGGGVAAGAALLGAASIIGGLFFGKKLKKYLIGQDRTEEQLSSAEKQIIDTCRKISIAIKVELLVEARIDKKEFTELQKVIIQPLIEDIAEFYFENFELKELFADQEQKLRPLSIASLKMYSDQLARLNKGYTTA
jgi:hypothetical protein